MDTWGLFAGLAGRFLSGLLHHPSPALTGAAIFVNFGVGVVVQITTAAWPARRRFVVGIPTILVGLVVLVASAWTSPPSLALFLTAGLLTGIGASSIFRSSLGVVVSRANPDDRAGALATFFTVGYAALSLPVLGLGVALEYLSPQVTLLVFALIVGAGILAAAPTLLRRPDAGRGQAPRPRVPGLPHQGVPRARREPRDVSVDPAPSKTTGSERDMTTTEQIATVTHLRPVPARPLAARLATAPGLVRAGAASWDGGRTPIHPLSLESAYADADLLRDLGARGARFARELGVDVVVGAETAGVPRAAAVSLAGGQPFAFVRKPGHRGHEIDEPPVRGADVAGRRVLLVDDAISSGASVERFTAALASVGAEVVGVFVLVDMRDVADTVSPVAAALPTESVSSYLEVLDLAAADGILDPEVHDLTVDAALHHWAEDDPRWDLLPVAA